MIWGTENFWLNSGSTVWKCVRMYICEVCKEAQHLTSQVGHKSNNIQSFKKEVGTQKCKKRKKKKHV